MIIDLWGGSGMDAVKAISVRATSPTKKRARPKRSWCAAFLLSLTAVFSFATQIGNSGAGETGKGQSKESVQLAERLKRGWNTWDTRNVLSHVFLPEGFAITLEIKIDQQKITGPKLGRIGKDKWEITPGGHAYDGSYTDLTVKWRGIGIRVQTASRDRDIDILVSNDHPSDETALSIVPEMK
jgi:hypothetical protein